MGAWAHASFDNDDAMDWVAELGAAKGSQPISAALDGVLGAGDGYLEAPVASVGLAAAEVVAALLGRPAKKLPDEVKTWVAGRKPPTEALVSKAQQVVRRVRDNSELKELWAESPDSSLWQEGVEDLLRRLGAA